MKKSLYWAAGALIAGMTFAGAASAGSLPAKDLTLGGASGLTQELSARCRVVVTHYWRHGRRHTARRTVCRHRPYCRTVVTHKWRHGHRITVRKRIC
jgi:hypothetical protein